MKNILKYNNKIIKQEKKEKTKTESTYKIMQKTMSNIIISSLW